MKFHQVTPFMHVQDIEAALAFFRDLLGFSIGFRIDNYAYVSSGPVAFRLLEEKDPACGAPPGNRRFAYYVDVEGVDDLFASLKPKLDTLPAGDVHGPVDQPYGQREFMVLAPDGNLLAFGESLEAIATRGR